MHCSAEWRTIEYINFNYLFELYRYRSLCGKCLWTRFWFDYIVKFIKSAWKTIFWWENDDSGGIYIAHQNLFTIFIRLGRNGFFFLVEFRVRGMKIRINSLFIVEIASITNIYWYRNFAIVINHVQLDSIRRIHSTIQQQQQKLAATKNMVIWSLYTTSLVVPFCCLFVLSAKTI